jgi:polysaccharide export outer membrane protein
VRPLLSSTPAARRAGRPVVAGLAALSAALLLAGCRTPDISYVWADRLPDDEEVPYVIEPGDTLGVRVFGQDAMTSQPRVRADGMISLPFVNDIEAAGDTPAGLAKRIQQRLKDYFANPVVTVSLEAARPLEVSVVGEAVRPGLYRLEPGAGVLTALAAAGGFTDYADRDRIFVIRNGTKRIRFTYGALSKAAEKTARFRLRPGDVVVLE